MTSASGTFELTTEPQRVDFERVFDATPLIEAGPEDGYDPSYFGVAIGFVNVDRDGFTVQGSWPPGREPTPLTFNYTATTN